MLSLRGNFGGALDARDDRRPRGSGHPRSTVMNDVSPLVPYCAIVEHARIFECRFGRDAGGRMLQAYSLALKLKPIVTCEIAEPLPGLFLHHRVVVPWQPFSAVRMLGDVKAD